MRWFVLLALLSCKGKEKEPSPQKPIVADAATIDAAPTWTAACADALGGKMGAVRKLAAILDACTPCGDWKPLLEWNTPMTEGGAPEQALIDQMIACKAHCSKDAQMQFNSALPDARGKPTNKPWRVLGDKCGAAVSAVPDTRFMSAPFFALDRIARAAAADPKLAPLLASLELPLPALSISGVGFELAVAPVMNPDVPPVHVTVTLAEIRYGTLPKAKLGANGVEVDLGKSPYPGELATTKDLAQKLGDAPRVLLIAPTGTPATRVHEVVKAIGAKSIVLAVVAQGAPRGWTLPGMVPVELNAAPANDKFVWKLDDKVDAQIADLKSKPDAAFDAPRVKIDKTATVAHLAQLLGALAFRGSKSASLAL